MAAYAALVTLINNIDNIHTHPHLSTSFDNNQIESLAEKLDFFLDFIETACNSYGGINKEEVEDLEAQIAAAVHSAEDVIESHIANQILAGYNGEIPPSFLDISVLLSLVPKLTFLIKKMALKVSEICRLQIVKLHLHRIAREMDVIKERVIDAKKRRGLKNQSAMVEPSSSRTLTLTTGNTTSVGFNGYLLQLLDWLTGQQSDRQIIPITGMGGIGKTTLARNAYENLLIVQHFYVRVWVTISQEFNKEKTLLEILYCLGLGASSTGLKTEELGEKLYKFLSGRKYLIMLDDMWKTDDWDEIQRYFPNNGNGSRIVVTTRICNVGSYLGSFGLALNLLDDDQSWTLFCEKVFGQEDCPLELKGPAKWIVRKCGGLPLSIVVASGILRNSSREIEHWEYVARELRSILSLGEGNQCSSVLFLSYSHLPARLKPCFLYLGMFPEDHEIRVSNLIKLWVAEGFLKCNNDQSLEDVAEGIVKDLIDRNLVFVGRLGSQGKVKTCKVHDLVRDLCVMVGEKEKFIYMMWEIETPRDRDSERRIGFCGNAFRGSTEYKVFVKSSAARSFISLKANAFCSDARLLRVLYNVNTDPDTVFQQVNLRYLPSYPIEKYHRLPSSISLLWSLQTLVIPEEIHVLAPSEIWEMRQQRHFKCTSLTLPDPPSGHDQDGTVLQNFQTLKTVCGFRFSTEACKRMASIRKLHIYYKETGLSNCYLDNVGRLDKLESLSCIIRSPPQPNGLLQHLKFPMSLKKLVLTNCGLCWDEMTIIGSLPYLEVLKLDRDSVAGSEWSPVEGDFLRLKFLSLHLCCGLISWNVDNSHFPVLERLELLYITELDEIPEGIGEIPTLESIYVCNCSFSMSISAIKILEKQKSDGNQGTKVRVEFRGESKLDLFREKVAEEGFTSLNFQLTVNGAL